MGKIINFLRYFGSIVLFFLFLYFGYQEIQNYNYYKAYYHERQVITEIVDWQKIDDDEDSYLHLRVKSNEIRDYLYFGKIAIDCVNGLDLPRFEVSCRVRGIESDGCDSSNNAKDLRGILYLPAGECVCK